MDKILPSKQIAEKYQLPEKMAIYIVGRLSNGQSIEHILQRLEEKRTALNQQIPFYLSKEERRRKLLNKYPLQREFHERKLNRIIFESNLKKQALNNYLFLTKFITQHPTISTEIQSLLDKKSKR